MIDIHSHVIFGVDDGPSTLEQSVNMVNTAGKAGIKTIIATPHMHERLFEAERLHDYYQEILFRTHDSGVSLKLGYEVFIGRNVSGTDKVNRLLTLDRTRYLLFELPFNCMPRQGIEAIQNYQFNEISPILAHPERNRNFIRNFNDFTGYIKSGCLIQVDSASILGVYGRDVREFVKKLIKWNMVDFVSSNAHCADDYNDWYIASYKQVAKWSGLENACKLFQKNAEVILNKKERMYAG